MTTLTGMRSASPGSFGAQMTSRPLASWRVTSWAMPDSSRWPLMATASKIELAGSSWRLIATSPKARSRSTRSVLIPIEARCTATFVESVVLPTPPLAEKTVTILPVSFATPPA